MITTNTRLRTVLRHCALPAVAIAAMTLAGCGSDGDSSSGADVASGSTESTVSVRETGDGQVLTTAGGLTLYVSDQEHGEVLCASGGCEKIWLPLTVSSDQQPSAPGDLASELGTVQRPDGTSQVALAGQPLYTFSFDHDAGDVNGDGESDSFDGVDFTWHAATPDAATPDGASPDTSSSPADGGGYGY